MICAGNDKHESRTPSGDVRGKIDIALILCYVLQSFSHFLNCFSMRTHYLLVACYIFSFLFFFDTIDSDELESSGEISEKDQSYEEFDLMGIEKK